ncbi:MAG: hypothetical protein ACI9BW_001207 [Gammaproteobacteria bacterium]|jgi:hypothetical protein
MSKIRKGCCLLFGVALCVTSELSAKDSIEQQAADTAEVFIYGQQSNNEALLREISSPTEFEAMAKQRAESTQRLNENVKVERVEITEIEGDRAVAKATYSEKHRKSEHQSDVHLKRVDGRWQVTTPPESGGK